MICVECQHDDGQGASPLEGASPKEVLLLCANWRCAECLRTDEEIQADYDAAAKKANHQSAHDWAALTKATRSAT